MTKWLSGSPRQNVGSAPGDEELRMIPRWSMALALVLFAGMQYIFRSDAAPQA
jgi:hypothetical protein